MSDPSTVPPRTARRQIGTFSRIWMAMLLVYWSLVACSGGGPTTPSPTPSGGPDFVVSSPSDGGTTAGTVLFAVQPFDPAEVARVDFEAGGTDLGRDSSAADGFAVFLTAADFPAGDLTLRATVRGDDGKESVQEITVTNVPAPPSSGTVGAGGAALGTSEASGALSTLLIPSGAPTGVDVTFEARTKAEVKSATGVDYDALGVTFLGAQEIATSAPLGTPLGISSGGFGPMVQPDQVVVNYMITDDRDGDGIGELVVVNTARVAPNGDVVADPVPRILLGAATITNSSGSRTLQTHQTGTVGGSPGTLIEFEAPVGFNPFSPLGNVARFTDANGETVDVNAVYNAEYGQDDGVPTIGVYLPVLPVGDATLSFSNVSSGVRTEPIPVRIEAAPPLSEAPETIIDRKLGELADALSGHPDLIGDTSPLTDLRATLDDLALDPTPSEQQALLDIATVLVNSNFDRLVEQLGAVDGTVAGLDGSRLGVYQCDVSDLLVDLGFGLVGLYVGALFAVGAVGLAIAPDPSTLTKLAAGAAGAISSAAFLGGGGLILSALNKCAKDALNAPCPVPGSPPDTSQQGVPPPPEGPDGGARQTGPTAGMTGMGSVVPPGGDACGIAAPGDGGAGALRSQQTGPDDPLPDLSGRYVIKVFYGAGNSVPFSGVSDAGGYFYLPSIPAGQPFEAIAIDTETNESRSFEGTGPEIGRSTYLAFDFGEEGPSGGTVLDYDTNTSGDHGDTDIYLFDGQAGDVINVAVFSEELRSGNLSYQLSDANGAQILSGTTTGGHYLETGVIELETSGLHSFTLDGSELTGGYTLGLAELQPPTAVDVTTLLTGDLDVLGDRLFYSFDASVDDTLTLTLRHPGSDLHGQLRVLVPDNATPFFQRDGLIRLQTTDTIRERSNVPRQLDEAGSYLLEIGPYDLFPADLGAYVGGWEVEVELESAP